MVKPNYEKCAKSSSSSINKNQPFTRKVIFTLKWVCVILEKSVCDQQRQILKPNVCSQNKEEQPETCSAQHPAPLIPAELLCLCSSALVFFAFYAAGLWSEAASKRGALEAGP